MPSSEELLRAYLAGEIPWPERFRYHYMLRILEEGIMPIPECPTPASRESIDWTIIARVIGDI